MRLTLSLFIALFSVVAAAQTPAQAPAIYRSVMPDGHIVFGDKPAPGAKESKPLVVRPSNISTPGPSSAPNPAARLPACATSRGSSWARRTTR